MITYEYVHPDGTGEITEWRKHLQRDQQAQLDSKIRMIWRVQNLAVLPNILAGTEQKYKTPHIFKLQIGKKIRLRPMVCKNPPGCITLLLGAIERGWKYEPENAPKIAEARRKEIEADPNKRRLYEQPKRPDR